MYNFGAFDEYKSQAKTPTSQPNPRMELIDTKNRPVVARGGVWKGKPSLKVQTPSDNINKFWGCHVQHGDYG